MTMIGKGVRLAAAVAAMVPAALSAQGLQYIGTVPNAGGGLGSVNTVLTLNNTNDVSSGCITPSGAGTAGTCGYANNTVQNTSTTRTLLEIGGAPGTLGTDLRIIANFSEPQGGQAGATINSLRLDLYNAAGTSVYNTSFTGPQVLPTTEPGVGNAGFGFSLNSVGAPAFQTALNTLLATQGNNTGNIRIGLGSSLGDVQGGLDTYSVARVNAAVVPEPSTYALMAAGLAAMGLVARRRRQA